MCHNWEGYLLDSTRFLAWPTIIYDQYRGLLHKYMNDSTITEEVVDHADSVNEIVEWSEDDYT